MGNNSKLAAERYLMECWRLAYGDGEVSALLRALELCLEGRYGIPDWVRDGFLAAFRSVERGEAMSWDEVFGAAKLLAKQGKSYWRAHEVFREVVDAKHEGKAIDSDLFAEIGEKLGIAGSTASGYYYSHKHFPEVVARIQRNSKKPR